MKSKIIISLSSICLMLFGTVTRAVANVRTEDKANNSDKFSEWVSPQPEAFKGFANRDPHTELFSQPIVPPTAESRQELSTGETQTTQTRTQLKSNSELQRELYSQPTVTEDSETQPQFSTDSTPESETELYSQPTVTEDSETQPQFSTQEIEPYSQPTVTPSWEFQPEFSTGEPQPTESLEEKARREETTPEAQSPEVPQRGFFNRDPQNELFSQPFYEGSPTPIRRRVLERGTEGAQVRGLQQRLQVHGFYDAEIDSMFGPRTEAAVIAFQQANGLQVTGLVERDTWKALETDPTPTLIVEVLTRGSRGSKVRTLQTRLQAKGYDPGPVDGVYGGLTESAVVAYQQAKALDASGVVDAKTWTALSQEWSQ